MNLRTTDSKFMFIARSRLNDFVTDNWMRQRVECTLDIRVFKMFRYVWKFCLNGLLTGARVLRPAKESIETSWHIKNDLNLCYSANVFLIDLRFCSSICSGSLTVVCEAIAMLFFVYMTVLDLPFTAVK